MSVCPPHAALGIARQVAGFGGVYVDANAISPATAREVAGIVGAGGAAYVDGGIIGTPPPEPGNIRIYLSGPRAEEVRGLFDYDGGGIEARVVSQDPDTVGGASAVKMAYASWTKGSAALLLAARALARAEGVEDALLAEWALSQPGLDARSGRAARSAAAKGWRWAAEMEEIAATMAGPACPVASTRPRPRSTGAPPAAMPTWMPCSPHCAARSRACAARSRALRGPGQQGPRRSAR